MRHKWKKMTGKPVKGEVSRKECKGCGLQVRKVRIGSGSRGRIDTKWRVGKLGLWQDTVWYSVPQCTARTKCPTCNGKGVVPT